MRNIWNKIATTAGTLVLSSTIATAQQADIGDKNNQNFLATEACDIAFSQTWPAKKQKPEAPEPEFEIVCQHPGSTEGTLATIGVHVTEDQDLKELDIIHTPNNAFSTDNKARYTPSNNLVELTIATNASDGSVLTPRIYTIDNNGLAIEKTEIIDFDSLSQNQPTPSHDDLFSINCTKHAVRDAIPHQTNSAVDFQCSANDGTNKFSLTLHVAKPPSRQVSIAVKQQSANNIDILTMNEGYLTRHQKSSTKPNDTSTTKNVFSRSGELTQSGPVLENTP